MRKNGIYMIENVVTKDSYIGSTRNLSHRKNQHFSLLRKGEHENRRLQNSFNIYGDACFVFAIIEEVESADKLIEREQYWMDMLKPTFNILLTATNNSITRTAALEEKYKRHSIIMTGKRASEETKRKMSESRKEFYKTHKKIVTEEQKRHLSEINTGERNPNWGKTRSAESREKVSNSNAKIRVCLLSPDGVKYQVENLAKFCREHNLNYFSTRCVAIGKRRINKGWTKVTE